MSVSPTPQPVHPAGVLLSLLATAVNQSKRGAVWSVDAIGNTVFSSVLEFRLSGKGDRFFGDGLVSSSTKRSLDTAVTARTLERLDYLLAKAGFYM